MKIFAKFLYWKLCFPSFVQILRLSLHVVSGPFQGMRYVKVACASAHSAKLLGTYEKELHPILEQVVRGRFETIIDIGAAEGYYAVGLARVGAGSGVKIIAFEAEEYGRRLLGQMASLNGVTDIEIRSACEVDELAQEVDGAGRMLIICDVEGFETELLDPDRIRGLRRCHILVELHDTSAVVASELLRDRFHNSHHIKEVPSTERTWEDFPAKNVFARILPRSLALRAMNEGRPCQKWFWMQPRQQHAKGLNQPLTLMSIAGESLAEEN